MKPFTAYTRADVLQSWWRAKRQAERTAALGLAS
jgi:hypothetical protein